MLGLYLFSLSQPQCKHILPLTSFNRVCGCRHVYSAKNCTGKVLSHRDAHNCKVKDKGKSWRSDITNQCTYLSSIQ